VFVFIDKMAVPPTYADLGKSAKDIFNKGYGNVFKTPLLQMTISFLFFSVIVSIWFIF